MAWYKHPLVPAMQPMQCTHWYQQCNLCNVPIGISNATYGMYPLVPAASNPARAPPDGERNCPLTQLVATPDMEVLKLL